MNKIITNENKEGFKHLGKGFIADKSKKEKEYYAENDTEKQIVESVKITYAVADNVAVMLIKMPYKFLSAMVNFVIRFVQQLNKMLKPLYSFVQQMFNIVKNLVKKMYDQFRRIFGQFFAIMRNLPAFIQKYVNIAIDNINMVVNQSIKIFTTFFEIFQSVFNSLLQVPQQMFSIVQSLTTFGFNSFKMAMKLPESGLKLGINLQSKMSDFMDKQ